MDVSGFDGKEVLENIELQISRINDETIEFWIRKPHNKHLHVIRTNVKIDTTMVTQKYNFEYQMTGGSIDLEKEGIFKMENGLPIISSRSKTKSSGDVVATIDFEAQN